MSGKRVVVLGGSSPFTAGLIDALRSQPFLCQPPTLVLHGRNQRNLDLVSRYASEQLSPLGWEVASTESIECALEGAAIVVHQIRYDGLVGRADGERLCAELGVPADETLGPAALLTAIRTLPDLQRTCEALKHICPNACVLNLTNPLSAITSAMLTFGVRNCVGLCELPLVTMRAVAAKFGLGPEQIEWSYAGLNHRGFIDSLFHGGLDLISQLPEAMPSGDEPDEQLGGITANEVDELQAVPLKYFRLLRSQPQSSPARAPILIDLREQIASELASTTSTSPPSLRKRYMDWYPHSVVPLISSLLADEPRVPAMHVVNAKREDGLAVETFARVHSLRLQPEFRTSTNNKVNHWVRRFEGHERAFVSAMLDPSSHSIRAAFELDPLLPASAIALATSNLLSTAFQTGATKP